MSASGEIRGVRNASTKGSQNLRSDRGDGTSRRERVGCRPEVGTRRPVNLDPGLDGHRRVPVDDVTRGGGVRARRKAIVPGLSG